MKLKRIGTSTEIRLQTKKIAVVSNIGRVLLYLQINWLVGNYSHGVQ